MPSVGRRGVVWAAVAGVAATAFVAVSPFVRLAYRLPELHVAIDTAAGLVALVVAYIFFGRFRSEPSSTFLVLAWAFGVAGVTDLFLLALPASLESEPRVFSAWAPAVGRSIVAAALAVAAFARPRPVEVRPRMGWLVAASVIGFVTLVGIVMALARSSLPVGVDTVTGTAERIPSLEGHSGVLALQTGAMVLAGAAALGFQNLADRRRDELLMWTAASATLTAFGRLNYLLFPSLYSEWISTGDLLRLAAHVVLLAGGAREIRAYWTGIAQAAVADERRRIARDLHDGLAQELAVVAGYARLLPDGHDPSGHGGRIAGAAERALDEARLAIHTLSQTGAETLDRAVEGLVDDLANRLHLQFDLALDEGIDASPEVVTAVLRTLREAVVNAAHHGEARRVSVQLAAGEGYLLVVSDDGLGYSHSDREGGLGVVGMRERTESLGGRFAIRPGEERGTEVEAWIPPS